jgi:Tfp pilus assembly protein PilO
MKTEEISTKEAKKKFSTNFLDKITGVASTTQGKTYTILGLTLITLGILVWFAVKPTISTIAQLDRKIKQYQHYSSLLTDKVTALSNLQRQYSESITNDGLLEPIQFLGDTALPATTNLPELYANLNYMAQTNSVALSAVTAEPLTANESLDVVSNLTGVSISLTASGSVTDLTSFLSEIENYPRPIHVKSMTISLDESAGSANYSLSATLITYYYSGQ